MTIKACYEVPVCPRCKHKTIYTRMDGSVRCRTCGYTGLAMTEEKPVLPEHSLKEGKR